MRKVYFTKITTLHTFVQHPLHKYSFHAYYHHTREHNLYPKPPTVSQITAPSDHASHSIHPLLLSESPYLCLLSLNLDLQVKWLFIKHKAHSTLPRVLVHTVEGVVGRNPSVEIGDCAALLGLGLEGFGC